MQPSPGLQVHSVAWAAKELGVAWDTVMDAVTLWRAPSSTNLPGWASPPPSASTRPRSWPPPPPREPGGCRASVTWRTASSSTLIEGREAPDLDRWLAKRPDEWKTVVKVTVADLHEPFRTALKHHLPDATAVADPFHVAAVGTRCVDATRRRVQNDTLGHRGRKADPLYRCRKLLATAEERLEGNGTAKLRGLLAAGDPFGHVHEAWTDRIVFVTCIASTTSPSSPAAGSTASSTTARAPRPRRSRAWLGPSSDGGHRSWPGTPPGPRTAQLKG
jgi:transposase